MEYWHDMIISVTWYDTRIEPKELYRGRDDEFHALPHSSASEGLMSHDESVPSFIVFAC